MNLVIDIGNSLVKLAIFKSKQLVLKTSIKHEYFSEQYKALKQNYHIQRTIVSTVKKIQGEQFQSLLQDYNVLELNIKTKHPFINNYTTPLTLGLDRVALVSACVDQFLYKNCLIIDAGTCITYDFIRKDNTYLGGSISPGLRMRYKSLHNQTDKLPLLNTDMPKCFIGNSTKSSIHAGVVNGLIQEMEGIIFQYKENYPDLTVILTGGDANFLSKQLKNKIFVNPFFLLEGLNFLLEFNTL